MKDMKASEIEQAFGYMSAIKCKNCDGVTDSDGAVLTCIACYEKVVAAHEVTRRLWNKDKAELAAMKDANQWNPVHCTPDETGRYLVVVAGYVHEALYGPSGWVVGPYYRPHEVTHWRKLPTAPKG